MSKKVISFLLGTILTFFLITKYNIDALVSIPILIASFIFINFTIKKINKKNNKLTIILSIIMSILYVVCDSVQSTYTINIFNKYLLLNLSGYFIFFYLLFMNIFTFIDKYLKKEKEDNKVYIGNKEILSTTKFSFMINFLLIFTINLIFLLKYYPGNLTYDSFNELSQVKGILPLMNNHSILHTGILVLFIKFGMLFKSINLGVFLYSLFQIIIVSLTFSYILYFLAKQSVPLIIRIISLGLFAFHPINVFYSFTIWKDVLFSCSFVIFTILIYYLSKDTNFFMKKKNILLFILFSLLVMYLRNNGVYVVLISLVIVYLLLRKKTVRILPVFISVILLFFTSKLIIFNALDIKDFDSREMLSLPSQSISRIYKNNYDKLTKKEISEIEKFYNNKIGEVYNPIISDNTKNLLDGKYYLKHKKEYIKLNISLFKKYSKEYIESFVSNSYGYYYVNTDYPSIMLQKSDLLGVKHKEILGNLAIYLILVFIFTLIGLVVLWNLKEKKNILLPGILLPILLIIFNIKDYSIIKVFLNIGIYVFLTFICLVYNAKNKKNIIYYIPTIILWITILFSPVYSEFRYLYPLFLLIPIFIGLTFKAND